MRFINNGFSIGSYYFIYNPKFEECFIGVFNPINNEAYIKVYTSLVISNGKIRKRQLYYNEIRGVVRIQKDDLVWKLTEAEIQNNLIMEFI